MLLGLFNEMRAAKVPVSVRELLDLPERSGPPDFRILRTWTDRGYARPAATHYVLETEPEFGAQAIVTMLGDERLVARPPRAVRVPCPAARWRSGRSAAGTARRIRRDRRPARAGRRRPAAGRDGCRSPRRAYDLG